MPFVAVMHGYRKTRFFCWTCTGFLGLLTLYIVSLPQKQNPSLKPKQQALISAEGVQKTLWKQQVEESARKKTLFLTAKTSKIQATKNQIEEALYQVEASFVETVTSGLKKPQLLYSPYAIYRPKEGSILFSQVDIYGEEKRKKNGIWYSRNMHTPSLYFSFKEGFCRTDHLQIVCKPL